ncbi:hypothetical protein F5Y15DRAFT_412856 [Xylariaceae sp. FL0016]|nr:hypothetical protein F5Y15DRAFT_412856 [Xylariaceae sp. FL0016]
MSLLTSQAFKDLSALTGLLLLIALMIWVHCDKVLLTKSGDLSTSLSYAMRISIAVFATLFTGLVQSRIQHAFLRGFETQLRAIAGEYNSIAVNDEQRKQILINEAQSIDRRWRGALGIDDLYEKFTNLKTLATYLMCGLITLAIVSAFAPTTAHHSVKYLPLIPGSNFGSLSHVNGTYNPCVGITNATQDVDHFYWPLSNGSRVYGALNQCPPARTMGLAPNINSATPDDYVYSDLGVAVERTTIGSPATIYNGWSFGNLTKRHGTSLLRTTQCVPVMASNPVQCQRNGNMTVLTNQTFTMQIPSTLVLTSGLIANTTGTYNARNFTRDSAMLNDIWSVYNESDPDGSVGESLLGFSAVNDPQGTTTFAGYLAQGNATYVVSCTVGPRDSFEYRKVTLDLQAINAGNGSNQAWRLAGGEKCTPVNPTISNIHFVTAATACNDPVLERRGLDGFFATIVNAAKLNRAPPYAFPNSRNALEDTLGLITALGVSRLPMTDDVGVIADALDGQGGSATAVVQAIRLGTGNREALLLITPSLGSFCILAYQFFMSLRSGTRNKQSTNEEPTKAHRPTKFVAESLYELFNVAQGYQNRCPCKQDRSRRKTAMASRAFFDPIVLLRVAPLITSGLAMRFSHDQWFFLTTFLAPEHRDRANELVPSYFKKFFETGIKEIMVLYTLTPALGITNFWARPNAAWKWYAAGTALAVFHMAFVPLIAGPVKSLMDDEPKGEGNKALEEWLKVHMARSWLADIPAWACFTTACVFSLQPV